MDGGRECARQLEPARWVRVDLGIKGVSDRQILEIASSVSELC